MSVPTNRQGLLWHCLKPSSLSMLTHFWYQCRGLRFRPYKVFSSFQYALDGVRGHPAGGRQTYCSLSGRYDWQNAWLTSQLFNFRFFFVARAVSRRNSACDSTGAKQSDLVQLFGSRLPSTTIRYFARTGFPSPSFFMVEIARVGSARPTVGRSLSYSSSVITSHVSRLRRPSYSSLYERSQISLSVALRR